MTQPTRLDAQMAFLMEADRLKTILRATPIADDSRRENSAEHSWHLALFALVIGINLLADGLRDRFDPQRRDG